MDSRVSARNFVEINAPHRRVTCESPFQDYAPTSGRINKKPTGADQRVSYSTLSRLAGIAINQALTGPVKISRLAQRSHRPTKPLSPKLRMKKARGSWAAVRRGIGNEIAITKDRLRAVFCLCLGRSPSRRHRTMPRLLRTVVDEISPVLLEGLAWNRMCQLAPSVRLAYRKLLLS